MAGEVVQRAAAGLRMPGLACAQVAMRAFFGGLDPAFLLFPRARACFSANLPMAGKVERQPLSGVLAVAFSAQGALPKGFSGQQAVQSPVWKLWFPDRLQIAASANRGKKLNRSQGSSPEECTSVADTLSQSGCSPAKPAMGHLSHRLPTTPVPPFSMHPELNSTPTLPYHLIICPLSVDHHRRFHPAYKASFSRGTAPAWGRYQTRNIQ